MSNELPEYHQDYWKIYAQSFVYPLTSNQLFGKLINNPNVTGLYAEAWIRSLAKQMLPNFRVSTGAVIRSSNLSNRDPTNIPQCDLIIWDPSELPGIFEQGDFALVPTQSVHGIIEIKRTISSATELKKQLKERKQLLRIRCRKNLLGVVIEHNTGVYDGDVSPNWLDDDKWVKEYALVSLLNNNKPNTDEIMVFIYFLAQIAGHSALAV